MSARRTVFVTGASGQLGRAVIDLLLEAGTVEVVAGSRNPDRLGALAARGVTLRRIDFDEPSSFDEAFSGVERALIISTDNVGRRAPQQAAAIAAAARAGVAHLSYTSVIGADRWSYLLAQDHYATEQALAASGVAWTALRNNVYASMLLLLLPPAVASGRLVAAAGDGRVGFVTRDDCARAAAAVLASDTPPAGPIDITGPTAVSYADLAALAASVTGKPVTYTPVSIDESIRAHVAAGLPEQFAGVFAAFESAFAAGLMGATDDVARLTGRPGTSVADFLAAHRAALVAPPNAVHH